MEREKTSTARYKTIEINIYGGINMDLHIKDGKAFGTIYVVLFKIDGVDTVRVFSEIDKAQAFCRTINGYKTMFIETLDREV